MIRLTLLRSLLFLESAQGYARHISEEMCCFSGRGEDGMIAWTWSHFIKDPTNPSSPEWLAVSIVLLFREELGACFCSEFFFCLPVRSQLWDQHKCPIICPVCVHSAISDDQGSCACFRHHVPVSRYASSHSSQSGQGSILSLTAFAAADAKQKSLLIQQTNKQLSLDSDLIFCESRP